METTNILMVNQKTLRFEKQRRVINNLATKVQIYNTSVKQHNDKIREHNNKVRADIQAKAAVQSKITSERNVEEARLANKEHQRQIKLQEHQRQINLQEQQPKIEAEVQATAKPKSKNNAIKTIITCYNLNKNNKNI